MTEKSGPPSLCANQAFLTTAIFNESTARQAFKFVCRALPIPSNMIKSTPRVFISVLRPVRDHYVINVS